MYSTKQVAIKAAMFCPVWFLANYFYNYSLQFTTIGSSTILSSTSSFFTLVIGAMLRLEEFSVLKLLAVFITYINLF